jgi:ABC-type Co2+ transport system permease subunit
MQTASLIYTLIGVAITAIVLLINRHLFRRGGLTILEATYYVTALAGLVIGWYFNLRYMAEYGAQVGWAHWTGLLFVNPASASAAQDLILGNVIVLPIWTIIEARRSNMRAGWLYFPMSLLTSYAFALALFLALRERQLRLNTLAL